MRSCIYEGRVRHTRHQPVVHRFQYRVFQMFLDLDEIDDVFAGRWFWSAKRPALARFRRRDHLGPLDKPLKEAVCDLVEAKTGRRPDGPVALLTNLRYFGYCFNPVSFYYCYDRAGNRVETIVAEVNNTPWGERSTYVLPAADSRIDGETLRFSPAKHLHVSPFLTMDVGYDWSFTPPAGRLSVFMAAARDEQRVFDASLQLSRTEIAAGALARVLISYPLMTAKVIVAIYWQALRLALKRVPFVPHPRVSGMSRR